MSAVIHPVRVEIDEQAQAAYVRLSDAEVAHTAELSDCLLVDLDRYDMAVGIEILDLDARIPLAEVERRFHIHSSQVDILDLLQPTLRRAVFEQSPEGHAETVPALDGDATPAGI
ncbi:MAG: DUF2283 domain-containing protein [Microbacteriaceae bacterium]|jgi:uncharacterized protein YuzE|nr:DUF2283 domain-containing protein [Microbacteriaceae bacterium]MCI1206957.1 DUF2283 domain-containing protein [Microbacteriaceae bacterium]